VLGLPETTLRYKPKPESIFTTNSREHQGTTAAPERIKWFLGDNTSIYAPGDLEQAAEKVAAYLVRPQHMKRKTDRKQFFSSLLEGERWSKWRCENNGSAG
jgi:hypothetical protein